VLPWLKVYGLYSYSGHVNKRFRYYTLAKFVLTKVISVLLRKSHMTKKSLS